MKNKQVVKDDRGYRWFFHKNGKAEPTNWRDQARLIGLEAYKKEVQEKLYGKKS